jgi:hypothetical protein
MQQAAVIVWLISLRLGRGTSHGLDTAMITFMERYVAPFKRIENVMIANNARSGDIRLLGREWSSGLGLLCSSCRCGVSVLARLVERIHSNMFVLFFSGVKHWYSKPIPCSKRRGYHSFARHVYRYYEGMLSKE